MHIFIYSFGIIIFGYYWIVRALTLTISLACVYVSCFFLHWQQKGEGWWFWFAKVIHFSHSFHFIYPFFVTLIIYSIHVKIIHLIFWEIGIIFRTSHWTLVIQYATQFFFCTQFNWGFILTEAIPFFGETAPNDPNQIYI